MADDGKGARKRSGLEGSPRRYVMVEDVMWTIRLVDSAYDRRRPDLIFESDSVVRRVRNYPDDWFTLDEVALLALSERL